MYLAIYKKNKSKDKWTFASIAFDMETATKYSNTITAQAKKFGYDEASSVIQAFDTMQDIPKILDKVKPANLLYN